MPDDPSSLFFIDDKGQFVDGDFLTTLLAASILEKDPGADILYDVRASWAVRDTVARLGGQAHENRVGHAFFKTRMRKEGSTFGGEVSGHYYFRDFYCADSGTLPALLLLFLLPSEFLFVRFALLFLLSSLLEQFLAGLGGFVVGFAGGAEFFDAFA